MKQIWNKPRNWIIYNDRLSNFSNTTAIFCHRILELFMKVWQMLKSENWIIMYQLSCLIIQLYESSTAAHYQHKAEINFLFGFPVLILHDTPRLSINLSLPSQIISENFTGVVSAVNHMHTFYTVSLSSAVLMFCEAGGVTVLNLEIIP